jgi:hypothetical protein
VSLGELAARVDAELAVLEPLRNYQDAAKAAAVVLQDIGETGLGGAADQGGALVRPGWELAGVIGGGDGVKAALRFAGRLHVLAARERLPDGGTVIAIDGGRCCVVVQTLGGGERRECLSVCEWGRP